MTGRMEGRRVGGGPTVSGEATVVLRGLPVNGLEAVLKLGRRTELPLADDGPNNGTATDGRGEHDNDCDGGMRKTGCTELSIAAGAGGRRGGGDVARQRNRVDRYGLNVVGCQRGVVLRRRGRRVRG
jgi:hypothetical protein